MSVTLLDLLNTEKPYQLLQKPHNAILESIKQHLSELLNTRQINMPHLQHYGLPDVLTFYSDINTSKQALLMAIQTTVEHYEPRLKNILVELIAQCQESYILRIQIKADLLSGQKVSFHSDFLSGGKITVSSQT